MNNITTYIIISILLIILIINSFFAPQLREHFDTLSNDQQALKSLNLCGRNIVFPYFDKNNLTASQRALIDNSFLQSSPIGLCKIDTINSSNLLNESYSIVQENSLFYNLKKKCLAFKIDSINPNNDILEVTFKTNTLDNIRNLTLLILLNPLYIEFAVDSSHDTYGYRIAYEELRKASTTRNNTLDNTWRFGTETKNATLTIPFKAISKNNVGSIDKLFNYNDLSSNQKQLSASDISSIMQPLVDNRVVNMKVYYLDKLESSFQNIGRTLYLDYDKTNNTAGRAIIFDKNYQAAYSTNQEKYEFMNNIALMYSTYVYPIMTFDFNINVTKANLNGANKMLCKVYMNNAIGGSYQNCYNITDNTGGINKNNIFAASFEPNINNSNEYFMNVFISQNGECRNPNNILSINLPYLVQNNNINITLTVSPNELLILAKWNDTQSNDVRKRYIFGKKNDCGANPSYDPVTITSPNTKQNSDVNNDLHKLFVERLGSTRIPLQNIEMAYDKTYMKDLKTCTLGYVNLLTTYTA